VWSGMADKYGFLRFGDTDGILMFDVPNERYYFFTYTYLVVEGSELRAVCFEDITVDEEGNLQHKLNIYSSSKPLTIDSCGG